MRTLTCIKWFCLAGAAGCFVTSAKLPRRASTILVQKQIDACRWTGLTFGRGVLALSRQSIDEWSSARVCCPYVLGYIVFFLRFHLNKILIPSPSSTHLVVILCWKPCVHTWSSAYRLLFRSQREAAAAQRESGAGEPAAEIAETVGDDSEANDGGQKAAAEGDQAGGDAGGAGDVRDAEQQQQQQQQEEVGAGALPFGTAYHVPVVCEEVCIDPIVPRPYSVTFACGLASMCMVHTSTNCLA